MKIFLIGAEAVSDAHHLNIYLLYQHKLHILGIRFVDRENSVKPITLFCVFLYYYDFHSKLSLLPGRNSDFD